MYEVYEINTGEVVATFSDWRFAVSLAASLTEENEQDGYSYMVRAI